MRGLTRKQTPPHKRKGNGPGRFCRSCGSPVRDHASAKFTRGHHPVTGKSIKRESRVCDLKLVARERKNGKVRVYVPDSPQRTAENDAAFVHPATLRP